MNDIFGLIALMAVVVTVITGVAVLFRRRRILKGYAEMRKQYGQDWGC